MDELTEMSTNYTHFSLVDCATITKVKI